MSRFEGALDEIDLGSPSRSEEDTDDVESDGDVAETTGAQVGFRELDQLPLLAGVDRIQGREMVAPGPGLDLDDDDGGALSRPAIPRGSRDRCGRATCR